MCVVWGWVKLVYGGVLVLKRLGSLDCRGLRCFRAISMGKFSWVDMDLGMSDANIYV